MVALSYPVTFFDAAGKEFLMTIYDISEKAGVSIATVSRVLNGACNVSAQTRQKVLSVIEACGYTPNAFARGLGLNSMNTIGILCADSSDLYQANAVYHIERELRQNNYNCILCCTGYGLEDKQKYLNLLVNKKVDSVILVGSAFIADNDAENDYIRKAASRQEWGTGTRTRQELLARNQQIYADYLAGSRTSELASKYCLSEKSIQRILRKIKS